MLALNTRRPAIRQGVHTLLAGALSCAALCATADTKAFAAEDSVSRGSTAQCIDAIVVSGAGHDINLHPSAPALNEHLLDWADAVTSGGCPDGP